MAATELKSELIMQRLVSILDDIHPDNGDYWNDMSQGQVIRYLLDLDSAISLDTKPIIEVLSGTEDIEHLTTNHRELSQFEITIIGYVKSEDPQLIATLVSRLVKDVMKVIYADITLNDLCRTVHVRSVVTDEGELSYREHGQFEMTISVEYDFIWDNL